MKLKFILLLTLVSLALVACNPVDRIKEAASEELAETIAEQVSGAENIEFDAEDGSMSFSVDDGEGGQMDFSVDEAGDVAAITGMGFDIPLPDGLVNGAVQRVNNNGEEAMINASFDIEGMTKEALYQAMHETLTAQGFTYLDISNSGLTEPDATAMQLIVSYQHPDGYQFTMLGDESSIILGLLRLENSVAETTTDTNPVQPIPTALDGSMTLDKASYQTAETIEVTLVINTPLADDAWVGIIPTDTPHGLEADNDAVDISYVYVNTAVEGKVTLNAPTEAGTFDVRLFNTDSSDGVELASETITVTE